MSSPSAADDFTPDEGIAEPMARLGQGQGNEGARMLARLSAKMFEAAPPTEHIARFEVGERLGAGAMGVVYAAWDPKLERRVAIKLLREVPGRARDPDSGSRLLREAKAMARLRHPNVIRVHEVGTHEGQVFVAMELIEGCSLRSWLRERERSWRETVEVFVEAGKGLAAAHAASLVHRDFKPDNVLIEGERVFVGDFGLARRQLPGSAAGVERAPELLAPGVVVLDTTLTRTGAFVGTPAYMAPEAFTDAEPDARADQYSFCASLYEALYRERPFSQTTISSLRAAKADVELAPTHAEREGRVPRWLRRVVLRGLSPGPEDRFESMDALLDALTRGLARRRKLGLGVGVGLLAGAVALAGVALALRQPEASGPAPGPGVSLCADMDQHLEGVWDEARRGRVEQGFASVELAYAADLSERAAPVIEGYTSAWVEARHDACAATQLRGEQSAHAMDLRMRCLDRRLLELDALLARLESPTAKDVTQALHALYDLTPVDTCADVERLESSIPVPEDPDLQAAVAAIRDELDDVNAAMATAQHAEVEDPIRALFERADALDYRPLEAEVGLALCSVLSRTGQPQEAAQLLERASIDAQASGYDEIAAGAAILQIHVVGFQLRDVEGGRRHMRQGRALLERLGDPPRRLAGYARNAGTVEFAAGNLDGARDQFERALELNTQIYGREHHSVAESRSNLAVIERRLGHGEAALELYLQAKADFEAALGPQHPGLLSLLNNIAVSYMSLGRDAEAAATLEQAIALAERSFAPDHASVGHPYNNLGELRLGQGRYAEAAERFSQAIESWTRSLGPDHPLLAHPLTGRGATRLERGDAAGARDDLERAVEIRSQPGVPSAELGEAEFFLARALVALGEDPARSRELGELALTHLGDADGALVENAEIVAWLGDHEKN